MRGDCDLNQSGWGIGERDLVNFDAGLDAVGSEAFVKDFGNFNHEVVAEGGDKDVKGVDGGGFARLGCLGISGHFRTIDNERQWF